MIKSDINLQCEDHLDYKADIEPGESDNCGYCWDLFHFNTLLKASKNFPEHDIQLSVWNEETLRYFAIEVIE